MARFDFPFASKASGANSGVGSSVPVVPGERRFNTDDVSKQLLRVLQPLHVDSLSLHDASGELQWLNEGAFGPDEQGVVTDALDVFALDPSREDLQLRLDNDRSALVACARDPKAELIGIALVIVETPSGEESSARLSAPRLVALVRRFAQLMAPPPAAATAAAPTAARAAKKAQAPEEFSIGDDLPRSEGRSKAKAQAPAAAPAPAPVQSPTKTHAPAPAVAPAVLELGDELTWTDEPLPSESRPKAQIQTQTQTQTQTPAQSAEISQELTLSDEPSHIEAVQFGAAPIEPEPMIIERRARAASSDKSAVSSDTIHAHRYARLRAGGAARRYEVKAAPDASFTADLLLAKHVVKHLQRSGDRYTQTPASFAVPLSVHSVIEDGWVSQLQPRLTRAGLPDGLIGFCLPSAAWQQQHEATVRFIAQCEQAHCFVALDDFTLADSGLALLRSSAVKCLKIEAQLIASVVQDKFAHATLAAIVQAARVLGLYCVAKKVSSSSQVKWLAGAGIEFADGVSRGVAAAATRSDEALTLQSER